MKLKEIVTSQAVGSPQIPDRLGVITFNPEMQLLKKKKKKKKKLKEELTYAKFVYKNYKHDKTPRIKILDAEYPGIPGQKTYGQRKDILGWNINYVEGGRKDREEALRAMDEIDDFANLIGVDKKEKYNRIKIMFPQAAEYLRRYVKDHIKGYREKEGLFWKRKPL